MASAKSEETRIVMMSSSLMELYDVQIDIELEFQPITFYNPQECLDMLTDTDADEDLWEDEAPKVDKAQRIERQWGELELRLSFFSNAYNWQ